jgi:hypothetical protein
MRVWATSRHAFHVGDLQAGAKRDRRRWHSVGTPRRGYCDLALDKLDAQFGGSVGVQHRRGVLGWGTADSGRENCRYVGR